jgi:hypothetical protein
MPRRQAGAADSNIGFSAGCATNAGSEGKSGRKLVNAALAAGHFQAQRVPVSASAPITGPPHAGRQITTSFDGD